MPVVKTRSHSSDCSCCTPKNVSCVTPVVPYLGYECQDLLGVLKKELSKVNLLPTFILSFMLKQQVKRERTDFNKSYLLFEFQGGHSTEFKGGIFFCL